MRRAFGAIVLAVVLTGCSGSGQTAGTSEPVPTPSAVEISYDGPLYFPASESTHARAGAAGDIVDCDVWGNGGSYRARVYNSGATGDSPARALASAFSEGLRFEMAQDEMREARREKNRALFVAAVGGQVKQAVIVRNGPASKGAGGPGWHIESWARCDTTELPESFRKADGIQVWRDRSGRVVPVTKLDVRNGPEHCDWQTMTFLSIGKQGFVRDPKPDLKRYFSLPYREHARVPGDAVDTGYRHDSDALWLASDNSVAYIGSRSDAEVWPRTTTPLGCA